MQSFRQIGSKLWKIGAIKNRYSIVVYGVMRDSENKKFLIKTLGHFRKLGNENIFIVE